MADFLLVVAVVGFMVWLFNLSETKEKPPAKRAVFEVEVPDPTVASKEKVFDYLDRVSTVVAEQVFQQLKGLGKITDPLIERAFQDKIQYGRIFRTDYGLPPEVPQINIADITIFEIAGAFVENRRKYIEENCAEGDELRFRREPSNEFDPDAIAIYHERKKIGYVRRDDQYLVKDFIKEKKSPYFNSFFYDAAGEYTYASYYIQD